MRVLFVFIFSFVVGESVRIPAFKPPSDPLHIIVLNTPKCATGNLQTMFGTLLKCDAVKEVGEQHILRSCPDGSSVYRSHDTEATKKYYAEKGTLNNGRCVVVSAVRNPKSFLYSRFFETRRQWRVMCGDIDVDAEEHPTHKHTPHTTHTHNKHTHTHQAHTHTPSTQTKHTHTKHTHTKHTHTKHTHTHTHQAHTHTRHHAHTDTKHQAHTPGTTHTHRHQAPITRTHQARTHQAHTPSTHTHVHTKHTHRPSAHASGVCCCRGLSFMS